jgi:hypothetical protein
VATIYVPLRDEAVDVWRSVEAEGEAGAIYPISDAPAPPDEAWKFSPGSRVRCEWRELEGGPALAAV